MECQIKTKIQEIGNERTLEHWDHNVKKYFEKNIWDSGYEL